MTQPAASPNCVKWLDKLKQTNLRTWLNLSEIEQLISEQRAPTKVWVTSQAEGGMRTLTLKLNSIAKRYTTVEGSRDVTTDLLLDCCIIMPDAPDKPIQVRASTFIPDPTKNELYDLSRVFKSQTHRDHFVEDVMFMVDIQQEDTLAQHQRFANSFFRKFLGPNLGGPPEEQH